MAEDLVPEADAKNVFNFPALPTKIRMMIYEHVLSVGEISLGVACGAGLRRVFQALCQGKTFFKHVDSSILRASRQTHEEAAKILYSSNIFIFAFNSFRDGSVHQFFFKRIGEINKGYLRNLMLHVGTMDLWCCLIEMPTGLCQIADFWNEMPRYLNGFYLLNHELIGDSKEDPVLNRNLMLYHLIAAEFKDDLGLNKAVVGCNGEVGVLREDVKIDHQAGFRELEVLGEVYRQVELHSWGKTFSKGDKNRGRVILPFGSPVRDVPTIYHYGFRRGYTFYRETEVIEPEPTKPGFSRV